MEQKKAILDKQHLLAKTQGKRRSKSKNRDDEYGDEMEGMDQDLGPPVAPNYNEIVVSPEKEAEIMKEVVKMWPQVSPDGADQVAID